MSEWRDVPNWEGYYEVSDSGLVRHRATKGLITRTIDRGYYLVSLARQGRKRVERVHILVARAFHGESPFEGAIVNHKNLNKLDCAATNLEWKTQHYNTRHSAVLGATKQGESHYKTKLTDAQVAFIRDSNESTRGLAKMFGVQPSTISRVRNSLTHKRGAGRVRL